ncbi:Nuclear aminoacylation-dependent tRNA export pathway component, partial [Coemansia sp. RSA 2702]
MSGLSSYLFSTLSKVGGLGGSGVPDFPYTLGAKFDEFSGRTLWEVHAAQSSDGKHEATVFVFDKARGPSFTSVAQNSLKRLRTLRHPSMLRYLAGAETADAIYIATEPVVPLALELAADRSGADELTRWGLYRVSEALRFVNEDCKLVHANVSVSSVFVTKAGEWKLGGLELADAVGAQEGGQQVYRHFTSVVPGYAARMAPEVEAQDWARLEQGKAGALDGWGMACLIHECFNGDLSSASQMQTQGQIPAQLWPLHQRLRTADVRRRMTPAEFLQAGQRANGYLDSSFVRACRFIENVAMKEDDERSEFFAGLDATISGFPAEFTKHKILPELLKLVEFGGIGSSGHDAKVLSSIVQIGKGLDEAEYNELVAPAIVQLFGSNDRALRFSLLEHMHSFIGAIPAALVSKKVFPNYATGFLDAAPAIREATVKAALAVAPKLGHKQLNGELVKQLVRLVADPKPGIRTNALICIGKLCTAQRSGLELDGDGVSEASHRYVVCPALMQALRDQFPPVRSAALSVATACAARWDAMDIARRVVPAIAPLLVDGERPVRVAALKAVGAMVARVEAHAQGMPETMAKKQVPAAGKQSVGAQAEAAANMAAAADGWGGWAVSSLSSTISGAISLASSLPIAQQQERAPSAPPVAAASTSRVQSDPSLVQHQKPEATVSSPTTAAPARTQPALTAGATAGGWEFNDDWGDDNGDAWDIGNDDWDAVDKDTPAQSTPAGGMAAVASAPRPAPNVTVAKTSLKLAKPATKKQPAPRSGPAQTGAAPRRKGLGAMKLVSGEVPTEPVLSSKTGRIYEKRLLQKYIEENGREPQTDHGLSEDDLIAVSSDPPAVKPRPPTLTSVPALLSTFQNEWDALVLETFTLKQQYQQVRQELSQALYQNDAACRVIARLVKERDEARETLATLQAQVGTAAKSAKAAEDQMDVDSGKPAAEAEAELTPEEVYYEKAAETAKVLSKSRMKREVPAGLVSADAWKTVKESETVESLHSSTKPGIFSLDLDR